MDYDLPGQREKARYDRHRIMQKQQGKSFFAGLLGILAYTPDYEEYALSLPVDSTTNTGPLQSPTGAFYPQPWMVDGNPNS